MIRIVPFMLLGITACFGATSYGRRVDPKQIDRVEVCHTTKDAALQLLGSPYKQGGAGDLEILTYEYGGSDGTDQLVVAVDSKGVVVDKAHNAGYGYTAQNRCKQPQAAN
jgi:hypothetical protein